MSSLGGLVKPMADMASKAAKADRVKSVKLKVKLQPKDNTVTGKPNGGRG